MKLFRTNLYFLEDLGYFELTKNNIIELHPFHLKGIGKFIIVHDYGELYGEQVQPGDLIFLVEESKDAVYIPNYFVIRKDDKLARLFRKMIYGNETI